MVIGEFYRPEAALLHDFFRIGIANATVKKIFERILPQKKCILTHALYRQITSNDIRKYLIIAAIEMLKLLLIIFTAGHAAKRNQNQTSRIFLVGFVRTLATS